MMENIQSAPHPISGVKKILFVCIDSLYKTKNPDFSGFCYLSNYVEIEFLNSLLNLYFCQIEIFCQDMKKIELEIVALSHSITQTHSYAVVLGELNGLRLLPIVIGGFEAQAIAVALENMHPSRPLTHDLMKN